MNSIARRNLIAGGAILIGAPAIARRAHAADSTYDRIASAGVLRLGVITNRPPYFWQENGKWVGFSTQMGTDAAEAFSKAVGKPIRIEFVESSFATIILDIQADKLDVFFGLSYSEQREKAVYLVGPLYSLPEVALTARGSKLGDQWEAYDHPEVRVSVVVGTTDEQAARKFLQHAQIRGMKGTAEAVLDVQSGNSDVFITTILTGLGALKDSKSFEALHVLQPVYTQPSHGGTRRDGDGKFAAFLQDWAVQYRAAGRPKEVLLAAMRSYGLDVGRLPPDIQF